MNRLKSLTPYIASSALAIFAGLTAYACLRLGITSTSFPPIAGQLSPDLTPIDDRVVVFLIVTFSFAVGFAVQRWGASRVWPYLALSLIGVAAVGSLISNFLGLDVPVEPLLSGGLLAALMVQVNNLWHLDRQLTRAMFNAANSFGFIRPAQVGARLTMGLRLLDTVLPLNEAIVFRYSGSEPLEIIARLKGSTSKKGETASNSLWRDGIELCEKALAEGALTSQTSDDSTVSSVAVPLLHERQPVGVLLIRLGAEFSDDDDSLLQAVGSQFARNLKRHSYSINVTQNYTPGYLSRTSSQKKLDAFYVLRALLKEQRCNYNALSQINDGVAIAYLDGTLALTNPRLLDFAGITPDQIAGMDLFSLLDRFRSGVFDEPAIAVRRVLQTGIDYEGELNFSERNQTLGLRISLLRQQQKDDDDVGEPIGLAIYVSDLTKIKEYDKLKSDMISLMSHELRTPLTSINGFAELLTADDTIPEQAKEFVTIIANESQRMSRMINTFLSVTQLQRKDKQEVLKIPLRLDEVVRETIASLQSIAKKKRIRLVEQPAQRLPPVAADKGLITQAVKNLLHNAIKYSPERTTVTVSTALEAESVRVSVEDRGFGIPSESKDRVWEKFYRVVREGQEKDEESTGLGLSFVREVIEQHGGNVALESEEGRGSKFSFTLPRL